MRLNKPIGFFLFLWPILWALWLSNQKVPDFFMLMMFIMGVFLMRSLGCVLNDCIDKDIDCYVSRTSNRPLSCGVITISEALVLSCMLFFILFMLVVMAKFGMDIILLLLMVLVLTCMYPYTKSCMSFPQLFLGVTSGCSTLIVFSVVGVSLCTVLPWLLFLINMIWTIVYDTEYAMVDRDDDVFFSMNSSAVFLGSYEVMFIGMLQVVMLFLFIIVGLLMSLSMVFYIMLIGVAMLFLWQQMLIINRDSKSCFRAFLNNNYVGMLIFFGIALDVLIFHNI